MSGMQITYDLPVGEPKVGDLLTPISPKTKEPTGTVYLIIGVRKVRQREERPFTRWRLRVARNLKPELTDWECTTVWPLIWYRRAQWNRM